jgi:hypothetical protein
VNKLTRRGAPPAAQLTKHRTSHATLSLPSASSPEFMFLSVSLDFSSYNFHSNPETFPSLLWLLRNNFDVQSISL